MDREDHDRELTLLRRRLAVLTEEARKNDEAWRRAQAREMELLEADTLDALLERLTSGLRDELSARGRDLGRRRPRSRDPPPVVVAGRRLRRSRAACCSSTPCTALRLQSPPAAALGSASSIARITRCCFRRREALESVALLPLTRQERLIGSLNFGSRERERFKAALGTEFLHHLAVIAAFSLESAVNRARLVRSGFTDVLTGWHNRRYLQSRLHEELARCRRERTPLTCLMIDVDHFKSVNDRFGHLAGDEVLRQLAHCISAEVRGSDVSARYGGEEFVVLLPGTGCRGGLLARRAHSRRGRRRTVRAARRRGAAARHGIDRRSRASARRSTSSTSRSSASGCSPVPTLALYEAKAGGRNAVAQAANS